MIVYYILLIMLLLSLPSWAAEISGGGSGGGASTLDQAFDGGKTIDGATSLANALCVGDGASGAAGTREVCLYGDATLGPVIRPRVDGADTNSAWRCWTNLNCILYDVEGGAAILTVDPDAASVNAMYQFGANYRPRKSIYWGAGALSTDGTQCTAPSESANTVIKQWTIVCADNDGAIVYGSVAMPDAWDGGTVTFTWVIHQVAASTSAVQMDFAAKCLASDDALTAFGTPPTGEQPADITLTADNDILMATTAAVTVDGTTCSGGDVLFFTGQVDATASNAAIATAVETLGVKMEYTVNSLSD
jgi:hypothetical protein